MELHKALTYRMHVRSALWDVTKTTTCDHSKMKGIKHDCLEDILDIVAFGTCQSMINIFSKNTRETGVWDRPQI